MGVFSPPNWNTLKNKPSTVAGFGISDMAAQVSANERCKAWVNFNGTGTVAIRAAFNVSSITDNGVGDYTVNFTSALADANYGVSVSAAGSASAIIPKIFAATEGASPTLMSTTQVRVTNTSSGGTSDAGFFNVSIHR
ncbi:MAG: hypothetical protein ACOYB2_02965 [Limnohabitans sp.]